MQFSSNPDEAAVQERADTEQVFQVCKVAVAQAIAACRDWQAQHVGPDTSSSSSPAVKVTIRGLGPGLTSVKVADNGRGLPDQHKVLRSFYAGAFLVDGACVAGQHLRLRSTGLDESVLRVYSLSAGGARSGDVSIAQQDAMPKQCAVPFSGSELAFEVTGLAEQQVLDSVQAVLETHCILQPPVSLQLRTRGLGTVEDCDMHVVRWDPAASEQQQLAGGAEQRLLQGLQEWCAPTPLLDGPAEPTQGYPELPSPTAMEPSQANQLASCEGGGLAVAASSVGAGLRRPPDALPTVLIGHAGAIAEADGRAAASGGWGANVALALEADGSFDARQRQLHSGAAASDPAADHRVPVHLFQNEAMLCRPAGRIARALQGCCWAELGLEVKVADIRDVLSMAVLGARSQAGDEDTRLPQLLAAVVHLHHVSPRGAALPVQPPALPAKTEAKLVRAAMDDVLLQWKGRYPGELCSKLEGRVQRALPELARALMGIVLGSDNEAFQRDACGLLDFAGGDEELGPAIEERLQDCVGSWIQRRREDAAAERGQGMPMMLQSAEQAYRAEVQRA